MLSTRRVPVRAALVGCLALAIWSVPVEAQRRGGGGGERGPGAEVTLPADVRLRIQSFYEERGATGAQALPPGIRRNLERGKSLPPGIAKRSPPPALSASLELGDGFELVEVGLDVLLVEVATNIIHDVLENVIR
jgi:hypothetical protein